MAKAKTEYVCSECATRVSKWAGQCPDCRAWNTLQAEVNTGSGSSRFSGYAGAAAAKVTALSEVSVEDAPRLDLGMPELDRVLGGGLVPGSVILMGGDPGIGKSTLLLQVTAGLTRNRRCLYVTGEESLQQVAMRARRLGLEADGLDCAAETSVERILALADQEPPAVLVVDSIQTLYTEALQSAPGAVAQVRECAAQLTRFAKRSRTAVILVGHVTKDGAIAGPRVLEHMVDAVLYFEGDQGGRYRVIRAVKNRFGAVNEIGVFAMTDGGLKAISNPSALFLSGRENPAAGSAVGVMREGTRPLLVEIQALVDNSQLANPRRLAVGLDGQRLSMLLAVLHRHAGVRAGDQDVFMNVVGGVRVTETAADLPSLLAVVSSLRDQPLPADLVAFGEVGLSGELRPVFNGEDRLREAAKQGFSTAVVPQANRPKQSIDGLRVISVPTLAAAVAAVREG